MGKTSPPSCADASAQSASDPATPALVEHEKKTRKKKKSKESLADSNDDFDILTDVVQPRSSSNRRGKRQAKTQQNTRDAEMCPTATNIKSRRASRRSQKAKSYDEDPIKEGSQKTTKKSTSDNQSPETEDDFDILDVVRTRIAIHEDESEKDSAAPDKNIRNRGKMPEDAPGISPAHSPRTAAGTETPNAFADAENLPIPPTELRRGQRVAQESQPGAFAAQPGEASLERNRSLRFSLVGPNTTTASATTTMVTESNRNAPPVAVGGTQERPFMDEDTANLAEAQPVPDDEEAGFLQAEEVSPVELEQRQMRQTLEQMRIGMILLAVALLLAIILGLVFGLRNNGNRSIPMQPVVPSPAAPENSFAPSSPPTSLEDIFVRSLPVETQERVRVLSPQRSALEWLLKHPKRDLLSQQDMEQLFAMAVFYFAFGGSTWPEGPLDSWLNYDVDACDWFSSGAGFLAEGQQFGAESCNRGGDITQLILDFQYILDEPLLNPSIPPEIAMLSRLEILFFRGINASLPDLLPLEMTQLRTLTIFDVSHVYGTLPTYLGNFSLDELYLDYNSLTGSLPFDLSDMSNLKTLHLRNNTLTGRLPSDLGLFPALTDLLLSNNLITGPIPTELSLSKTVQNLHLQGNNLTGTIPTELGLLTSMTALALFDNNLTGTIPTELALLAEWCGFGLSGNNLSGIVPLEVLRFAMDISDNPNLSGTIPDDMCVIVFTSATGGSCTSEAIRCDEQLWQTGSGYISGARPEFTCTDQLCGCGCCFANGTADPNWTGPDASYELVPTDLSNFDPSVDNPLWPGAFPANSTVNTIMFNLFSDAFPQETNCSWGKQVSPTEFERIGEGLVLEAATLYSWSVALDPESLYRFEIVDSYGDGGGNGWYTITINAPSDGFENGTVLWNKTGSDYQISLSATIGTDINGNAYLVSATLVAPDDLPTNPGNPPEIPLGDFFVNATDVFPLPEVDIVNNTELEGNHNNTASNIFARSEPLP